jgi:hypothetical protein
VLIRSQELALAHWRRPFRSAGAPLELLGVLVVCVALSDDR